MTFGSDSFSAIAGRSDVGRALLHLIFLLSGFAALLYQLAWQRALYTILGTDIASATIVVTAFLLGLGSLLGGALAKSLPHMALALFAGFELVLCLFGASSLSLYAWAADWFAAISHAETAAFGFLAVALPTTLMGATLPLLVAHEVAVSGNVGRSVGGLYFANTAGASLGAFAAVGFLFASLGLSGTTHVAAALNALLAVGAAGLFWRSRGWP